MSVIHAQPQALPSTGRLLKATAVAVAVAAVILVTTVLPAEYGIDPTGISTQLGLNVLRAPPEAAVNDPPVLQPAAAATVPTQHSCDPLYSMSTPVDPAKVPEIKTHKQQEGKVR